MNTPSPQTTTVMIANPTKTTEADKVTKTGEATTIEEAEVECPTRTPGVERLIKTQEAGCPTKVTEVAKAMVNRKIEAPTPTAEIGAEDTVTKETTTITKTPQATTPLEQGILKPTFNAPPQEPASGYSEITRPLK